MDASRLSPPSVPDVVTDPVAAPPVVLTYLEPETFRSLPAGVAEAVPADIVTKALVLGRVLLKDTDLLMNEAVATVLHRSPDAMNGLIEMMRGGLVGILITRDPPADSPFGHDARLHPLFVRGRQSERDSSNGSAKYEMSAAVLSVVDQLDTACASAAGAFQRVDEVARGGNRYAAWLLDALEDRALTEAVPAFAQYEQNAVELVRRWCRFPGEWLTYLRAHASDLLRDSDREPGAALRLLTRSPVHRCLAAYARHHGGRRQVGLENLSQAIWNALQAADVKGYATWGLGQVEPPLLDAASVVPAFDYPYPRARVTQVAAAAPPFSVTGEVAEAIRAARTTRADAVAELRRASTLAGAGFTPLHDGCEALHSLATAFADSLVSRRSSPSAIKERRYTFEAVVVSVAGQVFGFALNAAGFLPPAWGKSGEVLGGVVGATAGGLITGLPSLRQAAEVDALAERVKRAMAVRYARVPVPPHIRPLAA